MAGRSITVLQLLPDLNWGGVERGTLEIAGELARRGHRSLVISAGGRLVEQLESLGTEHLTWPIGKKTPWTARLIFKLRSLLQEQHVDVLHARSRVPAWVAWLAWKSLPAAKRPRFITTVHGFYSVGRFSSIMASGEAVIAVSRSIADYIRQNYPKTPAESITVIPRGIDPREFPHALAPSPAWWTAWSEQYPNTVGREWLTLAGRITRLKGHEEFLTLIGQLTQRGRNVHGLIVGGDDPRRVGYSDELRQRVQALGLSDRVTFTGHRSDIREIYAASRAVLSLSTQPESFGRSVLEALAIGTPVLGFDHGGVGEVLGELNPQGLVPLGDTAALVNRAEELLARPRQWVAPFEKYRLADSLSAEVDLYEQMATAQVAKPARAAA